MAKLNWNVPEFKTYETGVDRGVLYQSGKPGIAWPGLITVKESNTNQNVGAVYLDGVKVRTSVSSADFEMTISAFSAPEEFCVNEGTKRLYPGLYATGQKHEYFGFSYRTLIGNQIEGNEFGYKIHFVYGCLAFSSPVNNSTITNVSVPTAKEWTVKTIPYALDEYVWFRSDVEGNLYQQRGLYSPVAHLVVSSRSINPESMEFLENVIYGTETTEPELPTPTELIEIVR